jgi:hypothetical protein
MNVDDIVANDDHRDALRMSATAVGGLAAVCGQRL